MFNLLPKDEKFYEELEQLADRVVSAAKQFESIVASFPNFVGQLNSIEQDRLAARKIFRESLLRLDQAFITPLDREDILGLITEMYGVVDRVSELSQRFRLYKVKDLHPTLNSQAKNLSTIANELDRIIHGLRKQEKLKDLKPALDAVSGAMELVKRDREVFLGGLFSEISDPLEVIKKKEIHDLLEEAIERCEEATETLARVLLKRGSSSRGRYLSRRRPYWSRRIRICPLRHSAVYPLGERSPVSQLPSYEHCHKRSPDEFSRACLRLRWDLSL